VRAVRGDEAGPGGYCWAFVGGAGIRCTNGSGGDREAKEPGRPEAREPEPAFLERGPGPVAECDDGAGGESDSGSPFGSVRTFGLCVRPGWVAYEGQGNRGLAASRRHERERAGTATTSGSCAAGGGSSSGRALRRGGLAKRVEEPRGHAPCLWVGRSTERRDGQGGGWRLPLGGGPGTSDRLGHARRSGDAATLDLQEHAGPGRAAHPTPASDQSREGRPAPPRAGVQPAGQPQDARGPTPVSRREVSPDHGGRRTTRRSSI